MRVCLEIIGLIVYVFVPLGAGIEKPMPGGLAVFYWAIFDDLQVRFLLRNSKRLAVYDVAKAALGQVDSD